MTKKQIELLLQGYNMAIDDVCDWLLNNTDHTEEFVEKLQQEMKV